ncbi:MAG: VTT domain-containing protein [Candidatus Pacebacteria bacterium]|nr:VTT domain-containing protein [Candidatus Paceibacterota bacterium]
MEDIPTLMDAVGLLGQLSYWGIFGLSLLANILIPVPEEVFLLALGYISGGDAPAVNPYLTTLIVIPGLLISDLFLYSLARSGNKYIAILEKKLQNFKFTRDREFVEKHIIKIIVISRFIVQFRFMGPVLAGTTNISRARFLAWDAFALFIYVPMMIGIGNYFHARISQVIQGIALVKNYILIAVSVMIFVWLARKIRALFFARFIFALSQPRGYVAL